MRSLSFWPWSWGHFESVEYNDNHGRFAGHSKRFSVDGDEHFLANCVIFYHQRRFYTDARKLSNMYGRKPIYLTGLSLVVVSSPSGPTVAKLPDASAMRGIQAIGTSVFSGRHRDYSQHNLSKTKPRHENFVRLCHHLGGIRADNQRPSHSLWRLVLHFNVNLPVRSRGVSQISIGILNIGLQNLLYSFIDRTENGIAAGLLITSKFIGIILAYSIYRMSFATGMNAANLQNDDCSFHRRACHHPRAHVCHPAREKGKSRA